MTVHTRTARAAACVALAGFLLPATARAAEQSAARKLGRGLAAMTCSFLEIPGNIVEVSRERGQGWGFTLGFAQGLGKTVVRVLVGVYETLTAPIEVPKGFAPVIDPEFPWDYFEEKK